MSQKIKIIAIVSLLQAMIQVAVCSLGIAQYACLIDILRDKDYLIFIKILYFLNPTRCGSVVNIGNFIEGIPNQAFVLIGKEPFTATRTLIVNCVSLGLGYAWAITSCVLLGASRNSHPRSLRWPWMINTFVVCGVDVVASVTFGNDSFHTKSLDDVMRYIGGTASGTGGAHVNTSAAAWLMLGLYSRGVLVFVINVGLTVLVALSENAPRHPLVETSDSESPNTLVQSPPLLQSGSPKVVNSPAQTADVSLVEELVEIRCKNTKPAGEIDTDPAPLSSFKPDTGKETPREEIPRAYISRAFRKMKKAVLYSRENSPIELGECSFEASRAENATERQGQKPWAYIPASPYQMRFHVPSDEDTPPVPLPDYTAIGPASRKNSVHRLPSKPPATIKKKALRRQLAVAEDDVMF